MILFFKKTGTHTSKHAQFFIFHVRYLFLWSPATGFIPFKVGLHNLQEKKRKGKKKTFFLDNEKTNEWVQDVVYNLLPKSYTQALRSLPMKPVQAVLESQNPLTET